MKGKKMPDFVRLAKAGIIKNREQDQLAEYQLWMEEEREKAEK